MQDKADLVSQASKTGEDAIRLHAFYKGKVQTFPKCAIRELKDFSIWYTPGVATCCQAIVTDPDRVFEQTNKGNTIAIVTDGTRVRGNHPHGQTSGAWVRRNQFGGHRSAEMF